MASSQSQSIRRTIEIFARVRPVAVVDKQLPYNIVSKDDDDNHEFLQLAGPKHCSDDGYLTNRQENLNFRFTRVFDQDSDQDAVFDAVAKPVIDSVLNGFNGTIFAYGQTGSGKTYTMIGSRHEFNLRGIVPRTLSYIFRKVNELDGEDGIDRVVHVSYLEIYNDTGYDLLKGQGINDANFRLEDLPKVVLMEDAFGQMHLRHLSVHQVKTETEALQLLYLGESTRNIAETPLNEVSTRSHCIFSIQVIGRKKGIDKVVKGKLHLVDLAGSERIANSPHISSHLLCEAKNINLALHYLEQVIVALGEEKRMHIPYRNSMMTSVLRDSLGGNCMTTMIATLSLDNRNHMESLSTCRFSQRVALVTNSARMNEEIDPTALIAQLKQENQRLKQILATSCFQIEESSEPLTHTEKIECKNLVSAYLCDPRQDAVLPVTPDMRMIQECFRVLKNHQKLLTMSAPVTDTNCQLLDAVHKRDTEIKVLAGILRKNGISIEFPSPTSNVLSSEMVKGLKLQDIVETSSTISVSSKKELENQVEINLEPDILNPTNCLPIPSEMPSTSQQSSSVVVAPPPTPTPTGEPVIDINVDTHLINMSPEKQQALKTFMKSYHGYNALTTVESNLEDLKEEINLIKNDIKTYKGAYKSIQKFPKSPGSFGYSGRQTSACSDSNSYRMPGGGSMSLEEAAKCSQKALLLQKKLLEEKEQSVKETEKTLRTMYSKSLKDFEVWHREKEMTKIPETKDTEEADKNGETESSSPWKRLSDKIEPIEQGESFMAIETLPDSACDNETDDKMTISSNSVDNPNPKCDTTTQNVASGDGYSMQNIPIMGDPDIDQEVLKFFKDRQRVFNNINNKSYSSK